MAKVKFFTTSDNGVRTIWVQNHSQKRALFISDDPKLIAKRIDEINEDIQKLNHFEVVLGLYQFAKHHGCVTVMRPKNSALGTLKIVPEGQKWILVLARGTDEIIVKRDASREVIRDKYMELMKMKGYQPDLFRSMWDYAHAKQKHALNTAN